MVKRRVSQVLLLAFSAIASVVPMAPGTAEAQRSEARVVLEVKLHDDVEVEVTRGELHSRSGRDLTTLRMAIAADARRAVPLLGDGAASGRARSRQAKELNRSARDLASYLRVEVRSEDAAERLLETLRGLDVVEMAYPAPRPAPPPTTPNFVGQQQHLTLAPDGLGISTSNGLNGGTGKSVRIADVEYSWNPAHEDLPSARVSGAAIRVGTPVDPFWDQDHGTAVLGVLGARKNSFGVVGESHQSRLHLVNAYSSEYGWNVPAAINASMAVLRPGDVILLEQQAYGPNGEYLPVEWVPSVYDAIVAATAAGIVVVEAAGNGSTDLGSGAYGSPFPQGRADSGAIMVGAGSVAGCSSGLGARARLEFSNFGPRVDVQGPGECVVTTGYGGLFSGGANATYTSTFSGTSSASAVVAGAVGILSSGYRAAVGLTATPQLLRSLLMTYSTPQLGVNQRVGPLPDVYRALVSVDTRPPDPPTGVTVALNSTGRPVLRWKAATDNQGILRYEVYRNGTLLTTVKPSSSYVDRTAPPTATSTYYLRAVDHAGLVSAPSAAVSITRP